MKKTGKIIAAIAASLCVVVSLITIGVSVVAQMAQEDAESFKESMSQAGESGAEVEAAQQFLMNLDHVKMMRRAIVGVVLSVVILIAVLINLSNVPFLTPAIATVAALVGAVYCGGLIAIIMVLALIGSALVLAANLQASKASS